MLEFAEKLTLRPGEMAESDIKVLKEAGFTDRDVLDVCEVVGYYAYANRIADGLGVSLETWLPED